MAEKLAARYAGANMEYFMPKSVLLLIDKNIATITLNRPEAMNSFNQNVAKDLLEVTTDVRNNKSIRAVILNGNGPCFMAGGDIRMFNEMMDSMPKGVDEMIDLLHRSIANLMNMPKPVLACVHGSVAGAGVSLMMACDLVIAADDTKFTLAYSGIGMSPDGGATYNLPRLVGNKKAMEWLLLSDMFDAQTAQTFGLINWSVSSSELAQQSQKIISKLVRGPSHSFAHIKRLVNATWDHSLEKQLAEEGKAFADCTVSADFRIGVESFLQKKRPEFAGS